MAAQSTKGTANNVTAQSLPSPNMLKGGYASKGKRRSGILQPPQSLIERLGYVRKDSIESAPFKSQIHLGPKDRKFLTAITRGDLPTVRRLLENDISDKASNSLSLSKEASLSEDLNINCSDALGRSALRIAIENDNLEIVELLLQYDQIDVGDALLHAIQNDSIGSVILLLNHASKRKNLRGVFGELPSTSFTSDMTPITLAAIKDNYAIIHLLLESGFPIPQPHDIRCKCDQCAYRGIAYNTLGLSRTRLNAYSALSSPSLICLSSRDPLLTSFELSWQLRTLARLEVEFSIDYDRLASQCRQFAVDLLDQVRDSTELSTILNYDPELRYFEERQRAITWKRQSTDSAFAEIGLESESNNSLTRLKLAIKLRQKQFIAHPSCQQYLSAIWYSAIPGFRQKSIMSQFAILVAIAFVSPFLCIANILLPQSKLGRLMVQPFIKFVCHSGSYLFFLGLLMMASQRFDITYMKVDEDQDIIMGSNPTGTEILIVIFVVGQVWADAKALWKLGLRDYINDRWHLLTFVINNLFVGVILLRTATIYLKHNPGKELAKYIELYDCDRFSWSATDPNLLCECIIAIATVFACLKLISIFTISAKIGPLQIAFGQMLVDIAKFGIVYFVLLLAFSSGLSQIYWFYAKPRNATVGMNTENGRENDAKFGSIFEIVQSLYWGLFSLIDLFALDIMQQHKLTAFVGKLLFGSYSFMGVIVLINALIAMMSDSYKKIQRQADVEWKFALAKLWLTYFEDIYDLPIPFNLVPTVSCVQNLGRGFLDICRFIRSLYRERKRSNSISSENVFSDQDEEELYIDEIVRRTHDRIFRYQQIIRELSKRYLIKRQESLAFQGVTEDDLAEIKQDISAFKYELLEILRHNAMKIPDYIQTSSTSASATFSPPMIKDAIVRLSTVDHSQTHRISSPGPGNSFVNRRHSLPMLMSRVLSNKAEQDDNDSPAPMGSPEIPMTMVMLEEERRRLSRRRSIRSSFKTMALEQKMFHSELARSVSRPTRHSASANDIFTISETVDF